MTAEQEKIAEGVIQKHRDKEGVYDWNDFIEAFQTTHSNRLVIGRTLIEKNIVCRHVTGSTRLTELGWNFKGFESERKSIIEKEERQNKIEELTLTKLKFEQFPAKFWWLIILITAFISILTTLVNNQIEQSSKQRETPQTEILLKK